MAGAVRAEPEGGYPKKAVATQVCSSGKANKATGECIDGEWVPGVSIITDWDAVEDAALPPNVAAQYGLDSKGKGKVNAGKAGKALADCMWCQYGKPAAAGAAIGAGLALAIGQEPMRGALYGAGAGLAYGAWRG